MLCARFTYSHMELLILVRDGLAPIPLTLIIYSYYVEVVKC
jgi:hypothetical protein